MIDFVLPDKYLKYVLGNVPFTVLNMTFRESHKGEDVKNLIKANILFKDMISFLLQNTPSDESSSVIRSKRIIPSMVNVDSGNISDYLEDNKINLSTVDKDKRYGDYHKRLLELDSTFDYKWDDYTKTFVNLIGETEVHEILSTLQVQGILKGTDLKNVFNEEYTFDDFLKKLNDANVRFDTLDNDKVIAQMANVTDLVGLQQKKELGNVKLNTLGSTKKLQDSINIDSYVDIDNNQLSDNDLNLMGKIQESKPILYDNIMKHIKVTTSFKKVEGELFTDEDGTERRAPDEIVIQKNVLRVEFDQIEYLREVFLQFGFGDMTTEDFQLTTRIVKAKSPFQDAKPNFPTGEESAKILYKDLEGVDSRTKVPLVYLIPITEKKKSKDKVLETNNIIGVKLIDTMEEKEFIYDSPADYANLVQRLEQIRSLSNIDELTKEIEKTLTTTNASSIPFIQSLISTVTPEKGSINLGKFIFEIKFTKNIKTKEDIIEKFSLQKKEGTDKAKLNDIYGRFKKFFTFNLDKFYTGNGMRLTIAIDQLNDKKRNEATQTIIANKNKNQKSQSPFQNTQTSYPYEKEYVTINTRNIIIEIFEADLGIIDDLEESGVLREKYKTKASSREIAAVEYRDALKDIIKDIKDVRKPTKEEKKKGKAKQTHDNKDIRNLMEFVVGLDALIKYLSDDNNKDGNLVGTQASRKRSRSKVPVPKSSKGGETIQQRSNIDKQHISVLDVYSEFARTGEEDSPKETEDEYLRNLVVENMAEAPIGIPLIQESRYKFKKVGPLNVKEFKINEQGVRLTETQDKKETRGQFSDSINTKDKNKDEDVNLEVVDLLETLSRNYELLNRWFV
tara:strand:+ start:4220 stop:6757 length:2538 start_codon:yes stop_codon:yes gene_type:complete